MRTAERDSEGAQARPHARVVYIAGRMHCGSTILDALLGACPDATSVGEPLTGLHRGPSERCACGATVVDCALWGPAMREYQERGGGGLLADAGWAWARSDVRRFPSLFVTRLHAAAAGRSARRAEWRRFAAITSGLATAVAGVTGASVIVDSSKEFTHGLMVLLSDTRNEVIHLIRDPVSTVGSYYWRQDRGSRLYFMKRTYRIRWLRFPALMVVAFSWNVGLLLGLLMQWRRPRQVLHVSYERLCRDPARELTRIGQFAHLDVAGVIQGVRDGQAFPAGHSLAGNAELDRAGGFVFQPNAEGRRRLPLHYRVGATLLALPGLLLRALLVRDREERAQPGQDEVGA
jgi:hypothetical protein